MVNHSRKSNITNAADFGFITRTFFFFFRNPTPLPWRHGTFLPCEPKVCQSINEKKAWHIINLNHFLIVRLYQVKLLIFLRWLIKLCFCQWCHQVSSTTPQASKLTNLSSLMIKRLLTLLLYTLTGLAIENYLTNIILPVLLVCDKFELVC